ncbi:MAG TPA: BTAD domain-containing putative transcriptional regulator, partial [Streptosporangiaceae bacterium]|nr:BTAD domain-containing putative transcriptional regulator [Streptosporangiaceae bacterium]
MAGELEFCLLGPLVVRSGGAVVPVRQAKQRVLLAALLLDANRAVGVDALAEAMWGTTLPPSAPTTVRNYVKRLRDALGDAGRARISSQPRGYSMQVSPGELDVRRFEVLLEAARGAARNGLWARAADQAGAALALWQGEALADIDSDLLRQREVSRLAEMRLYAQEICFDAAVHLGRQAEVIGELRQHVSAHPLRERFHALLMFALYRDGRQAEALAAYQHAYRVLADELAAEPGIELRQLHQRILTGEPAFGVTESASAPAQTPSGNPVGKASPGPAADHVPPAPRQAPGAGAGAVPRQLPAAVGCFTGRDSELAALTALLDARPGARPRAMVISAIGGTAGVGKTALAVHWAHQVAGRFPDGQLYVNLRGYGPGPPVPATDALAAFLRSLGVPGQDIPPEADERAARYRSLLAGKQVLIVLDNAGSADQVRPLLPGTPTCTVVVTSRDALAGLVARDGAARLDLDLLPPAEAVALLQTLIGPRADAEPEAVAELADQCCRLPLALRVAAELAAGRPAASLAGLTVELADLRTRLDLLGVGEDPRTQVRAVFSWSCRQLDADAARAFRLAGLHPGPDLEPYAAAALSGAALPQARRVLEVLARAHLICPAAPGRYVMHDLLQAYARELSAAVDGAQEQHAALTRLFDHYLHTAAAAMDTLFPAEHHRRPRIPQPDTPVPPLADPTAARQWLDGERPALVAAAAHTAARGWPGHATRLSAALSSYLTDGGHIPEAVTVFGHALGAARRTGDRAAEATALNQIGNVDWQQGRIQQASDHYRQAMALYRAAGDRAGEARVLANLGLAVMELGRYAQAARHQQEAVAMYRDIGDRFGEARALGSLGWARQLQGRYQDAAGYYQQSLDLSREIGDRLGEAWALASLGIADLRLCRYQHAAGYLEQAIAMLQEMGDTRGGSESMVRLGDVYLGLGCYEQAAGNFEQALAMSREIGHRVVEADALNGLGDVFFRTGEADKARAHHSTALRLASETGVPREQARAHSGL